MSIYRQHVVLKRHKSKKTAFLEAKMLFLCMFLLSCCLSGSMGSATEEFQANFKALVDQANTEIFIPGPAGRFQCNHVPCHLKKTIQWLKDHFKNDQTRTRVYLMEKSRDYIISTLNKAHTTPEEDGSCPMVEMSLQTALKRYRRFFQNLHEMC